MQESAACPNQRICYTTAHPFRYCIPFGVHVSPSDDQPVSRRGPGFHRGADHPVILWSGWPVRLVGLTDWQQQSWLVFASVLVTLD